MKIHPLLETDSETYPGNKKYWKIPIKSTKITRISDFLKKKALLSL